MNDLLSINEVEIIQQDIIMHIILEIVIATNSLHFRIGNW